MTHTHNESLPLTDAVVQLTGESGNASAILGRVHRAIQRSTHPELADIFLHEATESDYNHLLSTCMRYVEVR